MRVLLDTCVLLPAALREILLGAAAEGLIQPLWSPAILGEWAHAAARRGGAAGRAEALVAQAVAARDWPAALIAPPDPAVLPPESLPRLPDPNDVHVLAAAIAGGAEAIVTFNRDDFPRRVLAGYGIVPRDPDGLLWEVWSNAPEAVARAVARARARLPGDLAQGDLAANDAAAPPPLACTSPGADPRPVRAFLRRAGLPRLGRAMAAGGA